MTESTQITLSSPKSVEVSSGKLPRSVSLSCSFRESSEPKSLASGLSCKSRKRKAPAPLQKEIGEGKKLKQTEKNQTHSLETALKGNVLSGEQLKKKEMLEISISVGNGERVSLSKYLHESGFSYESQSVMVSTKIVNKYMINYLVSLFFGESENPLKNNSLDKLGLRRISNRWGVIQDIVKDTEPKITAEEATLSLLKNQGLAYESMFVFLDLFERSVSSNTEGCERKIDDQKYEDIRYPFSKTQFVGDVLEIAKGGHVCLKEFIEIFRSPSLKEVSEWEKMKASVWEKMEEGATFTEEMLLEHVRKCLKAKGGGKNKQALMDCLMKSDLKLDGKKWTLLNFLRSESGSNLSTVDVMNLLVKCIGTNAGSQKKQALVQCLSHLEVDLGGERVSLYTFLKLEVGLSASDAIHLLAKCVAGHGASKNKQAFLESLNHPEIELSGERVSLYTFLKLEAGLSALDAIHLLVKCICIDGGSKNKEAFLECLSQAEIDLNGEKVSLYAFLTSKQGCKLSSIEAIGIIVKFVGIGGGSKNKEAFLECLSQAEIDLNGEKVSLYRFLKLEVGVCASDAMHLLAKCIGVHGGSKNKQALVDCLSQAEVNLNGERVSLYAFLKLTAGLSALDAIQLIAKCIGADGGSKNKQAFVECLTQKERGLDGKTFVTFLNEKYDLSVAETIDLIVRCIGTNGGCKNKQALMECLTNQEMDLEGKKVSLFKFLISEKGGAMKVSEAMQLIVDLVGNNGGSKNKQAFLDCFNKEDVVLDGKKITLYAFLLSERGGCLSVAKAIHIIERCVGQGGGANNKQAFIECLNKPEIVLDDKSVSLYTFLCSNKSWGFSASEAIHLLLKCIGFGGGSKNKQVFLKSLRDLDFNLEDKKVSVYEFLKLGCGLNASDARQVIVKCIGCHGGVHNFQVFKDCFKKRKLYISVKNQTLYELLMSNQAGALSSLEAIRVIVKVVGSNGGAKNMQAFIDCLCKPEINLDGERVPFYTFLVSKQGGSLSSYDAIQTITKCIGFSGGSQNKKVLIDSFYKLEMDLDGKKVPLLKFLISKQGCGLSQYEAMQVILRVIGSGGGSKNKQAFIDCLSEPDIKMNGEFVSLYTLLSSKQGGAFNSSEVVQFITKCVGCGGGGKNMQVLKECFNKKLADIDTGKKSLYELFLSGKLTPKEAISMCLIFSINRSVLNIKDVFCLFESKEKECPTHSVIGVLNRLGISCYVILLNLVRKVLKHPNISADSKKRLFTVSCQSLVRLFLSKDSFLNQKKDGHPNWATPELARRCIHACTLYPGANINHELMERERVVVDWIRSYAEGYQFTKESLSVITSVQSLDDLKLLIELSNREIAQGRKTDVDDTYCEECLMVSLKILIECKQPIIQAILNYESMLFSWFSLKELSCLITILLGNIKTDQSICYFFENREEIERLLPSTNLKKSFLIYMKLSSLTPLSLQPLKLEDMQSVFEAIGHKPVEELSKKNRAELYSLHAIYTSLAALGNKEWFREMMNRLPKIFMSYTQFRRRYLNKIQKTDWPLLIRLIQKWNFEEENVTQEELMFLIRIRYQLPKDIVIDWSHLSKLETVKNGCCVLNRTRYPNWVFVVSYFQKVCAYLSEACCVVKQGERIVFDSNNDKNLTKYSFPLFKIECHKDGFVFKGESVESVTSFYSKSRLYTGLSMLEASVMKTTQDQKVSPSCDELETVRSIEYQKRSDDREEALISEEKTRKRKGENLESDCQQSKKIRMFSRQDIYNLYEVVSRQECLTGKDCEIFMQGASYLTETMLDVLTNKSLVEEIGNQEIQGKWKAFVDRYEKQEIEKVLEMIEDLATMQERGDAFSEDAKKEDEPMFSQLEEDFMCLFPDEIEDEELGFLPLVTVGSLFDFCEEEKEDVLQDFIFE